MFRKITEVWPNLIRGWRLNPDDDFIRAPSEEQESNEEAEVDEEQQPEEQVDRHQLILNYKNLYWTQLMTIEDLETGLARKWPMSSDIVEECEAVDALPPSDPDAWLPLFDPEKFNKDHGPLLVDEFRLSEADL